MRRDGGEVDNRLGSGGFEIVAAQHVDRNADIVRALFAALGGDDDVAESGARRLRFRRVWPGLPRGSRGGEDRTGDRQGEPSGSTTLVPEHEFRSDMSRGGKECVSPWRSRGYLDS